MLWKISVTTSLEAEDAASDLVQNTFCQPASSCTNAKSGETVVSVYLPKLPESSIELRRAIAAGLARIRDCGLNIGTGRISVQKIRSEDWAESWKRHFNPLEIGSALLIKPSWSRRRARKGRAVIVLDPGLSFGTGQHPTTAFCLRQLAARRQSGKAQSFFDIGTGSGILAIAAAKLGYSPVDAFDCDPEAVRAARANARRNRLTDGISIAVGDVTRLSRRGGKKKYHVLCANLTSSLLVDERKRILSRLRPDGVLIVAGILDAEFAGVQTHYERAGLKLVSARTEKEWRSAVFTFAGSGV